jgi:hypothetical protein
MLLRNFNKISIIFYPGLLLLLFAVWSCNWFASWDDSYDYQIKIDSVTFPQTWVNEGDTLKVAFWGKIGDDDCCSFARFDVTSTSDSSSFVVMAHKRVQYRVLCHSGVVMLDGKIYRIYPVSEGTYTIIVNQPDGSKLEKQIWIH